MSGPKPFSFSLPQGVPVAPNASHQHPINQGRPSWCSGAAVYETDQRTGQSVRRRYRCENPPENIVRDGEIVGVAALCSRCRELEAQSWDAERARRRIDESGPQVKSPRGGIERRDR